MEKTHLMRRLDLSILMNAGSFELPGFTVWASISKNLGKHPRLLVESRKCPVEVPVLRQRYFDECAFSLFAQQRLLSVCPGLLQLCRVR